MNRPVYLFGYRTSTDNPTMVALAAPRHLRPSPEGETTMFLKCLRSLTCIAALAAAPAFADDLRPDTPASVKGARVVGIDEARTLIDGKTAVFLDVRSPLNFGKGRIPGAVLVAYREKSEYKPDFDATQDSFDLGKLPADRNTGIVIYSDGAKGWKSYKATVLAVQAGYRNIAWMRDGFAAWTAKNLPVER